MSTDDGHEVFDFIKSSLMTVRDIDVDLTPGTYFSEIELDSLDHVFVQVELQKKFGVEISYNDFKDHQIQTFGELAAYVQSRRS